ncbi:MAG: hypothetical protein JWR75_712 [Devosia sp.]|nr:hypothetical protein [Devosia sp.]
MAFSLASDRPVSAAAPRSLFSGALNWLAQINTERARKTSLTALLELDQSRLNDLGINRDDVLEALRNPRSSGRILSARRTLNAWTSTAAV